jgi:hypothetical protein
MLEGASVWGLSDAKPAASHNKCTTKDDHCMCNWPECENFQKQILECLPDNHPWQGSILQLQSHGDSNRELALWYSVVHHLHLSSDDIKLKKYKIHHHHFSEIGWQQSSQKTTYINKATTKRFDGIIHQKAYDDKVNLLKYILGKLGWRV